jgi:hypothetical protein
MIVGESCGDYSKLNPKKSEEGGEAKVYKVYIE